MKQKRVPLMVAFITGLALTVYGGATFINIKAAHHQTVASENQQSIQVDLPDHQPISNEPAWMLINQTAALDLPAPNMVRVGSNSSVVECSVKDKPGQFFIAGIIVEDQSPDADQRTMFLNSGQPHVVEAGYTLPTNSNLVLN